MECSIALYDFEEEIKTLQQFPKEGIVIEDFGLGQRYCLIRVHNRREFLKYMATFPIDYPDSPPNFVLNSCSKYLSTSVPDEIKRLEMELHRKVKQLCRGKGFSIQKICEFLLNSLNMITETDGYEDFNDFLENILEYPKFTKNTPINSIHAWHPSGDLLIFNSAESAHHYGEIDELFDIESSHFQAGIQ